MTSNGKKTAPFLSNLLPRDMCKKMQFHHFKVGVFVEIAWVTKSTQRQSRYDFCLKSKE